jgi:hypothetical protein
VAKAGVGAGLPLGLAEETAHAALWLHDQGWDGGAAALDMMDGFVPGSEQDIAMHERDGECILRGACPAALGVSAMDLLLADPGPAGVDLGPVAHPVLLIGLMGQALRRSGTRGDAVAIRCRDAAVGTVAGDWIRVERPPPVADAWSIRIARSVRSPVRRASPVTDLVPSPAIWDRLSALASRTLVPADAASRAGGAGAGDIDNE